MFVFAFNVSLREFPFFLLRYHLYFYLGELLVGEVMFQKRE
jgi:hypothetical protein